MNAQHLLLDESIRSLPLDIIENILWRLPIEEIVRASILCKEWRYIWTKIPKVAFTEDLFDESSDENQLHIVEQECENQPSERKKTSRRCRLFNAIYQFLILHRGPIVDFTLSMRTMSPYDTSFDCVQIDQILLHLSRKNTFLASSTLNGFGSLTTLCLEYVDICKKVLMQILSNNPLLKSFTMLTGQADTIGIYHDDEYSTINALFQCLPVIEHLTLCVWDIQSFIGETVPQKLETSLVHLKYLRLERMCFLDNDWLRFLVLMIRSSPNLEKLKIEMLCEDTSHWMYFIEDDIYPVRMQDYSDIWLGHLVELEIEDLIIKKPNLDFVKLILAKSPVLKTVRLMSYNKDAELNLLDALLPSPRASPMVEIVVVVKEPSYSSC
ncbi:F-box/FBD/LRR-repeat protein At1g13570-like [Rutidosis leptorrhynchoides]|uniref:F-box/FBD/LRR-repeat protein At1g13570-like n=1 Tax=Rutidosis leptorrhynchoides TaxID=125765 RepID=UPI003A99B8C8